MRTDEDTMVIREMMKRGGSFVNALASAAMVADSDNLARLKAAFPECWERYLQFAMAEKDTQKQEG
jgi:hypothetical protein